MRLIDEQWLKAPFFGSRRMTGLLRREGYSVNLKKGPRFMGKMGLEAVYPRPKTTRPHPDHPVYPYLLKGLAVDRPGLGGRHHLLADAQGLHVSGGCHGLAQPKSAFLALVEHPGG